jgi:hypothetical protein
VAGSGRPRRPRGRPARALAARRGCPFAIPGDSRYPESHLRPGGPPTCRFATSPWAPAPRCC